MSRSLLFSLAGFLAGLLVLLALFGDVSGFHQGMDFDGGELEDFRDFYHPTGEALLRTGRATPGFLYPPSFALALVPLGQLEASLAVDVWLCLQLLATGLLIGLGLVLLRAEPPLMGLGVFLAVTGVPLAHNLHWGQVSVLLALLVLGAVLCEVRGNRNLAVVAIALAASIKVYPLLFLLVPLLRGEKARSLRGVLLAAFLAVVLPMLALGPVQTVEFLGQMIGELGARRGEALVAPNAQAFAPVVARWTGLAASHLAWLGVVLALTQLPFLRRVAGDPVLAYSGVAITLPLFVEPHWPHYFALLPFVQLVCLVRGDAVARGLAGCSYLLSSLLLFRAFPEAEAYGGSGLLLVADLLLLVALRRVPLGGEGGCLADGQARSLGSLCASDTQP